MKEEAIKFVSTRSEEPIFRYKDSEGVVHVGWRECEEAWVRDVVRDEIRKGLAKDPDIDLD